MSLMKMREKLAAPPTFGQIVTQAALVAVLAAFFLRSFLVDPNQGAAGGLGIAFVLALLAFVNWQRLRDAREVRFLPRRILCPSCEASIALTQEEREQARFSCSSCGDDFEVADEYDDAARCDCSYGFVSETMGAEAEMLGLAKEVKNGANWFYWIAGLTVLNSLLALIGSGEYFVVGLSLSVTDFIRGYTMGVLADPDPLGGASLMLAAILEGVIALGFVAVGRAASRGFGPAFLLGGLPYALDAILCLRSGQYVSLAFHALALLCIIKGYLASWSLRQSTRRGPRPRWTWRTYAQSAAAMVVFAPMVLVFVVSFALSSQQWDLMESQTLARAPETFSEIDRERHHRAWLAVAARFERGDVSMEEVTEMNEALFKITERAEGEFVSHEEFLEFVAVLEAVGKSESTTLDNTPGRLER